MRADRVHRQPFSHLDACNEHESMRWIVSAQLAIARSDVVMPPVNQESKTRAIAGVGGDGTGSRVPGSYRAPSPETQPARHDPIPDRYFPPSARRGKDLALRWG